jgi:lysozyme family protein/cell wall-associated NlpC family hydrolase
MPTLTNSLRHEYQALYDSCQVANGRGPAIAATVAKIKRNRARYEAVGEPLGVPWYVVALIHAMEASLSFTTHLHNGNPLTARTAHVPKGRPVTGSPPFTWEESARDALTYEGFAAWHDWSIPGVLYKLEAYNGWGYRHHPECGYTPYLWSFSNHYTKGKYVGDGVFSATAVSQQMGAGVLLRELLGHASMNGHAGPRVLQLANPDMTGPDVVAAQRLLKENGFGVFDPGDVDGDFGPTTAGAVWRAKWELGYPSKQVNSSYGPRLALYLDGTKALPADFAARRQKRLREAHAERAVRAKIVEWAMWGVTNAGRIGYSEQGPRLATLTTPGKLPLTTDCSGFATLCYAWADAPNPNANGPYDADGMNYTGTMLARCRHIPPQAAQPGDLVVWRGTSSPHGHHVAIVVEPGADAKLVSHGQPADPVGVTFSAESAAQARYHATSAIWLTVF